MFGLDTIGLTGKKDLNRFGEKSSIFANRFSAGCDEKLIPNGHGQNMSFVKILKYLTVRLVETVTG
jgi:hypothetical protein